MFFVQSEPKKNSYATTDFEYEYHIEVTHLTFTKAQLQCSRLQPDKGSRLAYFETAEARDKFRFILQQHQGKYKTNITADEKWIKFFQVEDN